MFVLVSVVSKNLMPFRPNSSLRDSTRAEGEVAIAGDDEALQIVMGLRRENGSREAIAVRY